MTLLEDSLHDPLNFTDLEGSYNFRPELHHRYAFFRVLKTEIEARRTSPTVLDVGCGSGIGGDLEMQKTIGHLAGKFWGVEPDEESGIDRNLFEYVWIGSLEEADLPTESVDVAYAFMVMEHVQNPDQFFKTIDRILKPGGIFLFATPNACHIFGFMSKWLNRLKLDEAVLRLLKPRKQIEEYHYPLTYRCNTEQDIRRWAEKNGLSVQIAFYESTHSLGSYLRGPLGIIRRILHIKRHVIKQKSALIHIIALVSKAST